RCSARLLRAAAAHGARVLLNGSVEDARRLGFAGVHWSAAALATAHTRPRDLLVGASCHTREELDHAARLDADFALLGPVDRTPTHAGVSPLGWERFAELVAGARLPVYAIG